MYVLLLLHRKYIDLFSSVVKYTYNGSHPEKNKARFLQETSSLFKKYLIS